MSLTAAQVSALYQDILFETANHSTDITTIAASPNSDASTIAGQIASSPEAAVASYTYSLYTAVLGKAPDAAGLSYWVNQAESNLTAAQIVAGTITPAMTAFLNQSFLNAAGLQTVSPTALVTALYNHNVGQVDPAGLTYWVNQFNAWAANSGQTYALNHLVSSFVNAAGASASSIHSMLVSGALSDSGSGPSYPTIAFVPAGVLDSAVTTTAHVPSINIIPSINITNAASVALPPAVTNAFADLAATHVTTSTPADNILGGVGSVVIQLVGQHDTAGNLGSLLVLHG